MKVTMLTDKRGKDGAVIRSFEKGNIYEIKDEDLAKVFIDQKWAIEEAELFDDEEVEKELVALQDMTKKELYAYAQEKGIELNVTTKGAMLDTILEVLTLTPAEIETKTD